MENEVVVVFIIMVDSQTRRFLSTEVAMTTVTITLPDERLSKLKELAASLGVSSEELVRVSIEELLTRPEKAFRQAADYVLRKNAELYRRLT